jgi:hypothetical protein
MVSDSQNTKNVLHLQKWIANHKSDFTSPGGEFYLGSLGGIGDENISLMYVYVDLGQIENGFACLKNAIKYQEYQYELLKYWKKKVLPFIVGEERESFISKLFGIRNQSIINELKDLFSQFGIDAHSHNIDTFLKEEKRNFVKMNFSNKEKFEKARISIVNSIQMIEYYIVPKLLFWSQNISDLEFLKFLDSSMTKAKYPGGIHYKLFTGYILGNDISKEIDFFTSKKNSYYFYVKDMAFAMKYLQENNREKFLESLLDSLDGYKKDCRSFLNGFKGRYQEDFSLDALAVARLGALKGWRIDIEHEKFPKEFFNFILEKTLPK